MSDLYDENYLYNLYAIVCHIGDNYHVGHYTAYCRDGECWFKYDDDVVNKVQMDVGTKDYDTCTTNGYLLFYVRQDSEPNIMNLQPQNKFLKLDEEGNSALASKIVSNSSIVITPYIENEDTCDFISQSMNDISIKDYDIQQDKSQNKDASFTITENMKNISVLDDILDCDYDSEMEEDEKDDSTFVIIVFVTFGSF